MFESFVTLFTGAEVLYFVFLAISISMLVCEVFIPSFGVVGVCGIITGVCAILIRCLQGKISVVQIIMYIVYTILIIALIVLTVKFVYLYILNKKQKEKAVLKDGAVVTLTKEGNPDFNFLVNKEGVVKTDLKPSGKVEIDGKIYDVSSSKEYIYATNKVKVVKIEDTRIIVEKIN